MVKIVETCRTAGIFIIEVMFRKHGIYDRPPFLTTIMMSIAQVQKLLALALAHNMNGKKRSSYSFGQVFGDSCSPQVILSD